MNTSENHNEYLIAVGKRITEFLKAHGFSQQDILDEAESRGFDIKQSVFNKICNGNYTNPRAETLAQIADILNVSLDDLLSLDTEKTSISGKARPTLTQPANNTASSHVFITNPDDIHMKCYIKSFHTYFFPTKSSNDRDEILKGKLSFKKSDDRKKVIATLDFKTGKIDDLGEEISKHYEGELIISTFMSAAYCWLKNDDIGEISYLIFHYTPIAYEGLYARVALVLTSCTGDSRVPTAHRMIISDPEINDEDLEIIKGQLYLNGKEILISELGLEEILKRKEIQENESLKEFLKQEGTNLPKMGVMPVLYYKIEEDSIKNSFLSYESKLLLINLFRQYSSMPHCIKVGIKSDRFLYDFLKRRYDKKS